MNVSGMTPFKSKGHAQSAQKLKFRILALANCWGGGGEDCL